MSRLDDAKRHTDDVRRLASGRWDEIFSRLVPQIAAAMVKPGRHITCPFHGGKNDFRVAKATSTRPSFLEDGKCYCTCGSWDGFAMVMYANNWDFAKAVEEIEDVLGGVSRYVPVVAPVVRSSVTPEAQLKKDEKIKGNMKRWWNQTVPLTDQSATPARMYLKSRKLGQVIMPLDDIGYHPSLDYYDNEFNLVGKYPALISIVRMLDGSVSTVHRTYLTLNGEKAPVDEPRKQYSSPSSNPVMGSAIRLDKYQSPILHVGEGLESALAVRAIVDNVDPTWSTLNKELMRGLHVPEHVKLVCIWADRDAKYGGQLAAIELMDRIRAAGKKAVVMLPPFEVPEGKKSIDWADVVSALGLEATRRHFQVLKFLRTLEQFRGSIGQVQVKEAKKEVVA